MNVVKAIKWWRRVRHPDTKYPKGYPLEHLVGACCPDNMTSVAQGVTAALETTTTLYQHYASAKLTPCLPDHGVPQHNVLGRISGEDFAIFHADVSDAARLARRALDAESVRESAEAWRELFGDEFPAPPPSGGSDKSGEASPKRWIYRKGWYYDHRWGQVRPAMNSQRPSPALLAGRRALDGMSKVQVLTDWIWNPRVQRWTLHVRLTPPVNLKDLVPPSTEWYVLVDADYPQGQIKFFPSKLNDIEVTFPHQHFNDAAGPDTPWRSGDLCLDTNLRILGRFDIEPYDVPSRLEWHFRRALNWLEDASSSRLTVDGDPFELPHFPSDGSICTVAFSESPETYASWQSLRSACGIVELRKPVLWPRLLVVRRFLSFENRSLSRQNGGLPSSSLEMQASR